MRRPGLILLSLILIAVMILSVLQSDLLPAFFNLFTGEVDGEIFADDLDEEAPDGGGSADNGEVPPGNLKSLARQLTEGVSDDYEKLGAIYDWVTHNITYDLEKSKNIGEYGYGAAYLFKERKGVCHDYAELTRALLKAVGIKATYERGEVHPAPGKTENHAWNRALIGDTWYGLDTTWGSGFVDIEKEIFVPRPSRLYLTTPEELARLHSDPEYKEACEAKLRRSEALAAKPRSLPKYEGRLLKLINKSREEEGLNPLKEEARLLDRVRKSAAAAAEKECRGEEYTLDKLGEAIKDSALSLRLSSFGIYTLTLWDYPAPTAEELHRQILKQKDSFLDDDSVGGLTVGVVRRGDLIAVVMVGLTYY